MTTSTPYLERASFDDVLMALDEEELDIAFLVQTGSRAYGTATLYSDTDLIGFYVESDHETYGLQRAPRVKYRHRPGPFPRNDDGSLLGSIVNTLTDVEDGTELSFLQKMGTDERDDKADPNDVEILLLPMREYAQLAAAGNPEFFGPLFTDPESDLVVLMDERAAYLVAELREASISKHVCHRFAGYARSQRAVVLGEKKRRTNRHDLVTEHGYDTKAGSHLLRLLLVGHRLLAERTIHLPMPAEDISRVMAVCHGEAPLDELITQCDRLEQSLTEGIAVSSLSDEADMRAIDHALARVRTAGSLSRAFSAGAASQLLELVYYSYHPQSTGLYDPYALPRV